MMFCSDALGVALFVHGFAVFVGAGVAVQGHWLVADGAAYF
jgi:hypothetical protein